MWFLGRFFSREKNSEIAGVQAHQIRCRTYTLWLLLQAAILGQLDKRNQGLNGEPERAFSFFRGD
jgi:hypothetical protein